MNNDRSANRPRIGEVLLGLSVVALVLWFFAVASGVDFSGRDLIDSDGYMRYLRVESLLDGGGWFNNEVVRSNAPFGETLHWTRPLDVILVLISWVLAPFSDDSLYWAAVSIGPIMMMSTGLALLWGFRSLFRDRIMAALLIPGALMAPIAAGYLVAGRVDHHGLLILLLVLTLGAWMRLDEPWSPALFGLFLAAGMWVSVEFLVPTGLAAVTLAVQTISGRVPYRRAATVFGSAAAASIVALVAERGPEAATVAYERLSVAHVAVFVAAFLVFVAAGSLQSTKSGSVGNTIILTVLGVVTGAGLLAVFPGLLRNPFDVFDPVVVAEWLDRVQELQPVFQEGASFSDVYTIIGLPVITLLAALLTPGIRRKGQPLVVLAGWMICYVALALTQLRWAMFAQVLAVPLLLLTLEQWRLALSETRGSVLLKPLVTALVVVLVGFGGVFSASEEEGGGAGPAGCDDSAMYELMNGLESGIVLSEVSRGPEILYRTGHDVIAAPYGNVDGVRFYLDTFGEFDPDRLEETLRTRPVDYLAYCPTSAEARIASEAPPLAVLPGLSLDALPDYLEPVSTAPRQDFVVLKMNP